jgi:hypothetical protein
MEVFKKNTKVIVENERFESFNAEILKEEPWGLGEPVYLVRITAGKEFGCITHVRHGWITLIDDDRS